MSNNANNNYENLYSAITQNKRAYILHKLKNYENEWTVNSYRQYIDTIELTFKRSI